MTRMKITILMRDNLDTSIPKELNLFGEVPEYIDIDKLAEVLFHLEQEFNGSVTRHRIWTSIDVITDDKQTTGTTKEANGSSK